MHQDIINALGTNAVPTPLAANTTGEQGVTGSPGLRLMGFSFSAMSGTGYGVIVLRHGTSSGDPLLVHIDSRCDGLRDWYGPGGIAAPNGIYVDRVAGTTEITLYTKAN